jgi:hypothetical protein
MSKSEVVTTKRVILNAPGEKVTDIYYRDAATRVDHIETMNLMGRFQQSLILNFGSTSNLQIPNSGNILHQVFLHCKLPALQVNEFLNRGWLYNLVDSLTYTLGSSTQSQLRIDKYSIFQTAMLEMNSDEYRSMALVVAGDQHVNSTTDPIEATIIIPLPWSSVRASEMCAKKGIDTALLNTNINLQITLSQASKIYGGSAIHPTSALECYIYSREQELSNKANSIRDMLFSSGQNMYSYPFFHKQTPTPKQLMTEVDQTVNLAEFLESDLQNIYFSAHLDEDQDNTGGFSPNPLLCLHIEQIECLYNGQTIFKAPGRASRLIQPLYDGGSPAVKNSRIRRTGTISGQASDEVDSYVYMIPFASMDLKNIDYSCQYSNSPRFSNQTMQLKLKVLNPPNVAGSQPATVHFTYAYSAVAELSNGISTITFA